MRIRCIKPEFWMSESVGRLSREARLLFLGLLSACDDSGRTRAASRFLASELFPYDEDAAKHIDGWLAELEREKMVRRYVVDGSTYLDIPKWADHQKIDRPSKSKLPPFEKARETFASPREHSGEDQGSGIREQGSGIRDHQSPASAGVLALDSVPAKEIRVTTKDIYQLRAEALMRRRESTPMSAAEVRAWKTARVIVADTNEESWSLLEWWYALPIADAPYRKTDFAALLNNWHAEIEKARRNKASRRQVPAAKQEGVWELQQRESAIKQRMRDLSEGHEGQKYVGMQPGKNTPYEWTDEGRAEYERLQRELSTIKQRITGANTDQI